ncbi:sushi domain-containing protein 2 [Tiliqua scincoides]|uniref:sushi domain-containing protein 2 n=1 Tax=Tiliqua scincoides TaxID=71010 RepID=UPI0034624DC7
MRQSVGACVPLAQLIHSGLLPVPSVHFVLLKPQLTGAQDSCSDHCGTSLSTCSCQATCESLGVCCPDYWKFCLTISPYSGTLLGGKDFTVLNVTLDSSSDVKCRFAKTIETTGYVAEDGAVHCISPLLYQIGILSLDISSDGGRTFPRSGAWMSVHHSRVSPSEKSTLVNETKWQYYGTPGTTGNLTLTWSPQTLPATHVNIEVWGYNETGTPYSENWEAEWKYLYSLSRDLPNTGTFTFLPVPSAQYGAWELGALRISSNRYLDGQSNVAAIWSTEHALAWHLGETFRANSSAWATVKCHQWDTEDERLPNFLAELLDCPCTLAQARSDTGRFHADYGCDVDKGSVCTYHPGAVHCVRSVQASSQYAAGQQCCYDATGTQVLTGDSIGGSTPDRGHDWGAPPYKKPPRIPGFSHWLYDVLSFYYCCLWSDNCPVYFKRRPSSGCQRYRPPRTASAFGDPHFFTFDGIGFTFNGLGEYTVLESSLTSLRVQGRTRRVSWPNGTEARATGFSAIAVQEDNSDVVEIRLPEHSPQLEVLLNHKALSFSEQNWMDLKGLFLATTPGLNVTLMFSSGAGVEVQRSGRLLSLDVLLPEKFLNHTQGLFGVMNNDPGDDLAFRNGTTLHVSSHPEELFAFGADWAIRNGTSLFTYDTEYLLRHFFFGPKHSPYFVPVFVPTGDPTSPLFQQMDALCQADAFCRFDVLATGDLMVGNNTKSAHQDYKHLKDNLQTVVSCGWLAPPANGRKEGTNYLAGSVIRFQCNSGYSLAGSAERRCQDNAVWSGDPTTCVPNAARPPLCPCGPCPQAPSRCTSDDAAEQQRHGHLGLPPDLAQGFLACHDASWLSSLVCSPEQEGLHADGLGTLPYGHTGPLQHHPEGGGQALGQQKPSERCLELCTKYTVPTRGPNKGSLLPQGQAAGVSDSTK